MERIDTKINRIESVFIPPKFEIRVDDNEGRMTIPQSTPNLSFEIDAQGKHVGNVYNDV